jgi:hypothetical protein
VIKRIVAILTVLVGGPIALQVYDEWLTKPQAREASATFEKFVTPRLAVAELASKARELNAYRFQVRSDEDVTGKPKTAAAVVQWKAYHILPGGYECVVPLNQGKAESVKCRGDFM